MKQKKPWLTGLFFLILTIFSLKSILFKPGILGHTWDWSIPAFPKQYKIRALTNLSIWNNTALGGTFIQLKTEYPYWLMTLPFSFLGGKGVAKLTVVFILWLALLTMFLLLRKTFKLSFFWAGIGACFYGFSPFFYSRLIAGHLPFLIVYSLLPLFCHCLFKLVKIANFKEFKTNLPSFFLLILLLPFLTSVHHMAIISALIFCLFFIYALIVNKNRKIVLSLFFLLSFGFFLVISYLSFPLTYSVLNKQTVSLKAWEDVASQESLNQRFDYLNKVSQPLINLFTLNIPNNLYTEFVFPLPQVLKPFHIIITLLVFGLGFSSLFVFKKSRKVWFLDLIFCLSIILSLGTKTFIGKFLYHLLLKLSPTILAGFVNPLRFLPLLFLPLTILLPLVLEKIETNLKSFRKKSFKIVALFCLIIFFYPWFFQSLTKPLYKKGSQPLSLKLNQVHPEEKEVFDYFTNLKEDFRISFLPPYFVSWPGFSNLSYTWNFGYYAKPTFLENIHPPLAKAIITELYSPKASPLLSKLLGLANLKFLLFPHYENFGSNYNFIPGETDYKKIIDNNLKTQPDIKLLETNFQTVDIYENKDFLPHFYIPKKIVYTNGDETALAKIITHPDYQLESGIYLNQIKTQINYENNQIEYQFNIQKKSLYDIYLYNNKVWEKIDSQTLTQGEHKINLPLGEKENLIKNSCQPEPNNSLIIICQINNYPPGETLKLNLSYLSSQGNPGFVVVENNSPQPLIKQALPTNKPNQLNEVEYSIQTSPGASEAKLYLFIETNDSQTPNLSFKTIKLENQTEPLIMIQNTNNLEIPKISFEKISPSKYIVNISKSDKPYWLIFSESFHSQWQLYQEKKLISADSHRLINGFSNSWYLDSEKIGQDNYSLIVEFAPQKTYFIGLIISGLTFLTSLFYLLYNLIRKKNEKRNIKPK